MNSSSKVIMAATMVMVVSLVMVLSLVLVLLAELYCSLLLRRRRNHSLTLPITTTTTTTISAAATPTITTLNQVISTTNEETSPSHIDSSTNPLYTGVIQTPTKTHLSDPSLNLIHEPIINDSKSTASIDDFIYISNPIYSNESTTPFETPQSSPSHLETGDNSSSGEEDSDIIIEGDSTPTLTPMKDLPDKACSVSLKEVETSSTECNKDGFGSSSSSGSPYTSPSW